jgi:hypothetical protein
MLSMLFIGPLINSVIPPPGGTGATDGKAASAHSLAPLHLHSPADLLTSSSSDLLLTPDLLETLRFPGALPELDIEMTDAPGCGGGSDSALDSALGSAPGPAPGVSALGGNFGGNEGFCEVFTDLTDFLLEVRGC